MLIKKNALVVFFFINIFKIYIIIIIPLYSFFTAISIVIFVNSKLISSMLSFIPFFNQYCIRPIIPYEKN